MRYPRYQRLYFFFESWKLNVGQSCLAKPCAGQLRLPCVQSEVFLSPARVLMPRSGGRVGPYATGAGELRQDRKVATVTVASRVP